VQEGRRQRAEGFYEKMPLAKALRSFLPHSYFRRAALVIGYYQLLNQGYKASNLGASYFCKLLIDSASKMLALADIFAIERRGTLHLLLAHYNYIFWMLPKRLSEKYNRLN
jgi:hypothetical protein